MAPLAALSFLCFAFFGIAEAKPKGLQKAQGDIPQPGDAELASFSSYSGPAAANPLADLREWAEKARREAQPLQQLLLQLQRQQQQLDLIEDAENPEQQQLLLQQMQQQQQQQHPGHLTEKDAGSNQQQQQQQLLLQQEGGLGEAIMKFASLAAEFQKLEVQRKLAQREDPKLEQDAQALYRKYITVLDVVSSLSPSLLRAALPSAADSSLLLFLRPQPFVAAASPAAAAEYKSFSEYLLDFKIRQKQGSKGYNLDVRQALCIAQTDPEPEAREQALQAIDSIFKQRRFKKELHRRVQDLLQVWSVEEVERGIREFASDSNFNGEYEVARAAATAIEGGGVGLYKRVLRIRKHVFLRSKEGLRFGWGDRLSLPTTASSEAGAEYEEAFSLVAKILDGFAPSLSHLLSLWISEKRIEVAIGSGGRFIDGGDCPFDPSPLGIAIEGFGVTSPLTGSFISFNYTSDAGAPGLAQFLGRHLMEAKLVELNPLMASFLSLPPPSSSSSSSSSDSSSSSSSSSSSKSALARSNSLLIEATGLWLRHLAFQEDINSVFNPQQQLKLYLSYLDETLGRIVKGSLRTAFAQRLREWGDSERGLEEIEKLWLKAFKDRFGPEGDVFDTYAGVRSQWLFFDVFEEQLSMEALSTTAETLSSIGAPPKPAHILAFVALNKAVNDSYFIKGYNKNEQTRKPTKDAIANAFNAFLAEAEREGLVRALIATGARLDSPRFWTTAFHEAFDKPILEAEMLAQELSYFLTHKVKGAVSMN